MKKGDKRKLLTDYRLRTSYSVGTLPAGTIVEVQQVDSYYGNVLIENVWVHAKTFLDCSVEVDGDTYATMRELS